MSNSPAPADKPQDATMMTTRDCPLCQPGSEPNADTLAAMQELEEGRGKRCKSVEELMADLNSDDGATSTTHGD